MLVGLGRARIEWVAHVSTEILLYIYIVILRLYCVYRVLSKYSRNNSWWIYIYRNILFSRFRVIVAEPIIIPISLIQKPHFTVLIFTKLIPAEHSQRTLCIYLYTCWYMYIWMYTYNVTLYDGVRTVVGSSCGAHESVGANGWVEGVSSIV